MGKRFWFGVFDLLAITVLVSGAGLAFHAHQERQDRRSLRRIRHISHVFHQLPLVDAPAPLEDDPEGLARAAVRRLLDPNVSTSAADGAARVLRRLEQDLDLHWRSSCAPADAARAAALVDGVERFRGDEFASALDTAVGDWTGSAGWRDDEVPSAPAVVGPGAGVPSVKVRLEAPRAAVPGGSESFAVPDGLERVRVSAADLRAWR